MYILHIILRTAYFVLRTRTSYFEYIKRQPFSEQQEYHALVLLFWVFTVKNTGVLHVSLQVHPTFTTSPLDATFENKNHFFAVHSSIIPTYYEVFTCCCSPYYTKTQAVA